MDSSSASYVVAGLGNPGTSARFSRHNAGQIAASHFFRAAGGTHYVKYQDAWIGEVVVGTIRVVVCLPRSRREVSGPSVARHVRRFGIPTDRVIILHDDMTSQPGQVAVKVTGSSFHPGVISAMDALGVTSLTRVEIGIGSPVDWTSAFFRASLAAEERRQLLFAG